MLTKWNMTFFLFFGLIGAALLLGNALRSLQSEKLNRIFVFAAAVASVICLTVLALTISSPLKLLNILGHPSSGLSSAVITDILLIPAAFVLLRKTEKGKTAEILIAAVSVVCIYCFSRVYMVVTRPALNSVTVFAMLFLQCLLAALFFSEQYKREKLFRTIYLAAISAYGVVSAVFLFRIGFLAVPDRVLQLQRLFQGDLAFLFWFTAAATFFVPAGFILFSGFLRTDYKRFVIISCLTGLFALSMLINQMPVVSRGVDGRFFY
ncbi:hypothetical protein EP073_04385 [Geovibrio thiophilus]|uniref:Uncharacterized protein n=1 Tax=Geovibrio thiophilus TaxID=139438 RepID=A0A3R5UX72_9BACT|nr:hypothetical protein [Geovibrio thiophilus]QAR32672.1 hypothetical protein EP073_04385 [Geovibrio thiophilus]